MPPRRVSSFAGFDRLTLLSKSMSSGSASGDRQVRVHSLPPGGLTHDPRRALFLDAIPGSSQLRRRSSNPMSKSFMFDSRRRSSSIPSRSSGSSGDPGEQIVTARVMNLIEQTTRPESAVSSSPTPQEKKENEQILRESGRYASHITDTSNSVSASDNNRASVASSDSDTIPQSLYSVESQRRGGRPTRSLWQPEEEGRRRGGGRHTRRPTFRSTDRELQELLELPQLPAPAPLQRSQPPTPPQRRQSSPPSPPSPLPELLRSPPSPSYNDCPLTPTYLDSPTTAQFQGKKQVFDPASEEELEGLEVVGLRSEDGAVLYAGSCSSSGSSTPERKPTPLPTRDVSEEAETRVTRRQNELPVAIIPQTSMELERPNLIVKPVQYFEPPQSERLAIEYYPLGDDENDWTDEESWHCSDGEWPDPYEDDSDEEEDFGCIGLFHRPYENMLVAGKGFNLTWVEEVDNWPVPEEIKILGYRVIGHLGEEEEEDDDDEDEEEFEDEISERFQKSEGYKLQRKVSWLHGSDPIDDDDDDEWEDECETF
ncbi:hypothetical protein TWF506_001658 [Arthrobotrys conoides]|uniref:Uncharacterized protein n=1 Tax=Arthrobotrys conoides TaxID=74498 RepID=A0AAN8RYB4_9PEZI